MSLFRNIVKLISGPVGNNLDNAPDDVEALKRNFSYEGRYMKPVANGYIDSELNHAIYSFQRNNNLQVDGRVNPGGETETTLAGRILGFDRPRTAAPPGIVKVSAAPTLAYKLAPMLALPVMGAWEWWQNQTTPVRQQVLNALGTQQEPDHKEECDKIYQELMDTCARVRNEKGKEAGIICRQSANQIYGSCLAGKPQDQWPPLAE